MSTSQNSNKAESDGERQANKVTIGNNQKAQQIFEL